MVSALSAGLDWIVFSLVCESPCKEGGIPLQWDIICHHFSLPAEAYSLSTAV